MAVFLDKMDSKRLLKEGKISLLVPRGNSGAMSGEVHLLTYDGKKYIVRKCSTLKKARFCENISRTFQKYGFLPKFLGRHGKEVLYEFIEGRNAKNKESLDIFRQVGKIAGAINKIHAKDDFDYRFRSQLKELLTAKFKFNFKNNRNQMIHILKRINLSNWKKPKPIITKEEYERLLKVYVYLKREAKPTTALDANDVGYSNFRVSSTGKVYFIDIEAIKPRIKGFGIAKFFLNWGKSDKNNDAFYRGYVSSYGKSFFKDKYKDLCYMIFLVQRINYNANLYQKSGYKKLLKKLNEIADKYSVK